MRWVGGTLPEHVEGGSGGGRGGGKERGAFPVEDGGGEIARGREGREGGLRFRLKTIWTSHFRSSLLRSLNKSK